MEENEMKASSYTEKAPKTEGQPGVGGMNNSDGYADRKSPPLAQRPESSSSNDSDKLVLTSKVNRRKTNLGKKNASPSPTRGGHNQPDGVTPVDLPRQRTFAPGGNKGVRQVKRDGWANDADSDLL